MNQQTRSHINPSPKTSFTPVQSGLLQRKCGCGRSANLTGQCSECERKKLAPERGSTDLANEAESPPVMHEVLRLSDQHVASIASTRLKTTERRRAKTESEGTESQASPSSEANEQSDEIAAPISLLQGPFFSLEQAINDFARRFNPVSIDKCEEICSVFIWSQIKLPSRGLPTFPFIIYFYVNPWQHPDPLLRKDTCTALPRIPPFNGEKMPKNFAGEIHTHGCDDPWYDNENFSPADKSGCRQSGGPCYIVTPKNVIKKLQP